MMESTADYRLVDAGVSALNEADHLAHMAVHDGRAPRTYAGVRIDVLE